MKYVVMYDVKDGRHIYQFCTTLKAAKKAAKQANIFFRKSFIYKLAANSAQNT